MNRQKILRELRAQLERVVRNRHLSWHVGLNREARELFFNAGGDFFEEERRGGRQFTMWIQSWDQEMRIKFLTKCIREMVIGNA